MAEQRPSRSSPPSSTDASELKERAVLLVFETAAEQGERHGGVGKVAKQLGIGPGSFRH